LPSRLVSPLAPKNGVKRGEFARLARRKHLNSALKRATCTYSELHLRILFAFWENLDTILSSLNTGEPLSLYKTILVSTIVTFCTAAQAQEASNDGFPIATERPNFSDTSFLVPLGHWQIETGATYFRVNGTNSGEFPELMVRYPLSDRLELRLINVDYAAFDGGHGNGWQDPAIGFKYRLTRDKRKPLWDPQVSFVGLLELPYGSRLLRAPVYEPTVKLAADLPVGAADNLGGNILVSWLDSDQGHLTRYGFGAYWNHTLSSKLTSFVEVYGLNKEVPGGNGATFFDVGFQYLLNKATQVDIRYGAGTNQQQDGWFVGAGIAYRF